MGEMYKDFETLKKVVLSCEGCELSKTRTNVVFGVGSEQAEIMFVGEGPGEKEDLLGEPFVGRAGALLDVMLKEVGLSRQQVYIANMVKCRPPQNRDPKPEETNRCIEYLRNQFHLIRPKVIVCLGRIAAYEIISKDFKVTKEHGQWIFRKNTWLMGTFHPAAILRNPPLKEQALADFQSIIHKINEIKGC